MPNSPKTLFSSHTETIISVQQSIEERYHHLFTTFRCLSRKEDRILPASRKPELFGKEAQSERVSTWWRGRRQESRHNTSRSKRSAQLSRRSDDVQSHGQRIDTLLASERVSTWRGASTTRVKTRRRAGRRKSVCLSTQSDDDHRQGQRRDTLLASERVSPWRGRRQESRRNTSRSKRSAHLSRRSDDVQSHGRKGST